ncbi:hypothetical protein [Intestinibacter sp.]|uniref:hypothetical protein n=1 Tax=Intestinibacter sp. TaxID=1965304 RepID=UPI002A75C66C|nr:hypothetical protein [Intestinibacter sp.]MDY2736867.1 hypothetical protein [Intestinibacter sp.]
MRNMNKRNIVTKENIKKIADFLESSIEWLKEADQGCCGFPLSDDLSLYIGWSSGWAEDDDTVIHSKTEPSWAIDAAVKVRNDYDCSDFEYLNFPYYKDGGDCLFNSVAPSPKYTRKDFENNAKWFLETFVAMTNAHKKGEISYS